MTDAQQREAARQFFYRWNGRGKEDEDARSYWIELLQDILGVERVTERTEFEKKVAGNRSMKRIDVYIPETHVVIEQKSLGIPLDKPQPGHDNKTPYEQAKEYDNLLPYEERARWIITSNFAEIWIYDMSVMRPEPVKLALADLQTKYHLLDFLTNKRTKQITEEVELSKAAGELVGKIRDRFLTQYNDPLAKRTQKSLNILCVRLVFCFYAEDAGLFGKKDAFCEYLVQYAPKDMRGALIEFFKVLDTPLDERADMYLSDELAAFPYVNGGLFQDENIVIPKITQEIKDTLIESARFDWSKISPTIFGAVFESTLNPETRRKGGMHYTSIENIHRVIDPLFLDDLRAELDDIKKIRVPETQKKELKKYQRRLSNLVFFDPACGSGNFLTETYLSLRRIENEVLRLIAIADSVTTIGQIEFGFEQESPIQVSIHQFYGIEINDFAVSVAQTALWIAESQMMRETEDIIHQSLNFFPLKTYNGITEGNALRLDWRKAVPVNKLRYIIGNPPFVGKKEQTKEQKQDLTNVLGKSIKNAGNLDYVTAWYKKAAEIMVPALISAAFVSTNSITQGEQAPAFGKVLIDENISIDFARRSFVWNSEASDKAHVHCVIIGFSKAPGKSRKTIYIDNSAITAANINPYLVDAPSVLVISRAKPLYDVPEMNYGSMPIDDGHLILDRDAVNTLLEENPDNADMIRKYMGGVELLRNRERWCLWLVGVSASRLRKSPFIMDRLKKTADFRSKSGRQQTLALAETPALFGEIRQPQTTMLVIPKVSSEARRYIPIGFVEPNIIVNGSALIIPDADLYLFGVIMSNVHNSWMRTVAGRLEMRYQYSGKIVYNNFPWPSPTAAQKQQIERTAQGILDARALYPDSSLADLYDPLTMPPELRKAHQRNDAAVMQAYGMPIKETNEAACVAWLMRLYQEKIQGK